MKMRGYDLRDWVKIKAYYYLDWMSQRTKKTSQLAKSHEAQIAITIR